jgi:DDE superfamily endonuclease
VVDQQGEEHGALFPSHITSSQNNDRRCGPLGTRTGSCACTHRSSFRPTGAASSGPSLPGIGILSETSRKNGWQLAEHAREATPYGMQRLLSQAVWDVDLVRDELRAYALERLGAHDAILAIDETSFRHPLAPTRLALANSIAERQGKWRTAR